MNTQPSPDRAPRPQEERSFLSWTERAADYHRAEPSRLPRAPESQQPPTA